MGAARARAAWAIADFFTCLLLLNTRAAPPNQERAWRESRAGLRRRGVLSNKGGQNLCST